MATIVVGVDGSPGGDEALRWALAEAKLRGAEVRAVYAWSAPHPDSLGPIPLSSLRTDELSHIARTILDEAIDIAVGAAEAAHIRRDLVEGRPAAVLVEASAGADLLVVGSRGRGGFAGLRLGSVSQQCAHHADCPVVIVPLPRS